LPSVFRPSALESNLWHLLWFQKAAWATQMFRQRYQGAQLNLVGIFSDT